jgi:hypothetical protein
VLFSSHSGRQSLTGTTIRSWLVRETAVLKLSVRNRSLYLAVVAAIAAGAGRSLESLILNELGRPARAPRKLRTCTDRARGRLVVGSTPRPPGAHRAEHGRPVAHTWRCLEVEWDGFVLCEGWEWGVCGDEGVRDRLVFG